MKWMRRKVERVLHYRFQFIELLKAHELRSINILMVKLLEKEIRQ